MGLLNELTKSGKGGKGVNLGSLAKMAAQNPQLVSAAASLLSSKDTSVGGAKGLGGVLAALQSKGLGDQVSSWVGTGANKAISPQQLADALGNDTMQQFAKKAGLPAGSASSALSSLLPQLVNELSPNGALPEAGSLEGVLAKLR